MQFIITQVCMNSIQEQNKTSNEPEQIVKLNITCVVEIKPITSKPYSPLS